MIKSKQTIQELLADMKAMPAKEKLELLQDLEKLEKRKKLQDARDDFLKFCHAVYPGFKEGPHHRHLKPKLQKICHEENGRMTISMPPRMGKSELTSYLFVAWYMGHHPDHHIMMVTHTATLSASFGRKVRNLIDSPAYQEIFPGTKVSKDKSAADDWTTTVGGKYLAVGVGASIAGHGAHLCLDPNAEVLTSNGVRLLQSIVVGDTLITAQGRFEVTKKMLTTHTEGVSINEALLASGTHPFYTQRGWVPAGQLRPGDRVETRTVWMALWDRVKHILRKTLRLKRGAA